MTVFVNGTRVYGTAEHTDFSPLAWLDQAACRDYDPLLWDTHYYGTGDYDMALQVCWECPVMRDCQDWGDRAENNTTNTSHTMQHKGLQPAGQAHLQVEHGANPHLGLRMPFKGTLIAPDLAVEIPC